jgi:hypothetical protein
LGPQPPVKSGVLITGTETRQRRFWGGVHYGILMDINGMQQMMMENNGILMGYVKLVNTIW